MSAEAETILHHALDFGLSGFIGDEVKIAERILIFEVDCRWDNLVLQGHHADNKLDPSRSAQQMSQLAFSAGDGQFPGMRTENRFDGGCLGCIAKGVLVPCALM